MVKSFNLKRERASVKPYTFRGFQQKWEKTTFVAMFTETEGESTIVLPEEKVTPDNIENFTHWLEEKNKLPIGSKIQYKDGTK